MTRRERMLAGIDLRVERGIEIGALAAPIVTKDESDVRYVDWTDQQTLRAKYAGDRHVDGDRIVPVDAIWDDRPLRESLGGEVGFDYAIASHVIEHVPDMIGWLGEIAEVLRPGGRLVLAIPDRRFTFDFLRQTTRAGDLLEAWMRRNRRPAAANVYDFNANSVIVDPGVAWRGGLAGESLEYYTDKRAASRLAREAFEGAYHDTHCWVFTPACLFRIMIELADLDLLPYRCLAFYPTEDGSIEMLLVLERLGEGADKAEARASFASFIPELAAAEPDVDAARAEVVVLKARVAALEAGSAMLEAELAAVRSSTSWRITRPLRGVGRLLGR